MFTDLVDALTEAAKKINNDMAPRLWRIFLSFVGNWLPYIFMLLCIMLIGCSLVIFLPCTLVNQKVAIAVGIPGFLMFMTASLVKVKKYRFRTERRKKNVYLILFSFGSTLFGLSLAIHISLLDDQKLVPGLRLGSNPKHRVSFECDISKFQEFKQKSDSKYELRIFDKSNKKIYKGVFRSEETSIDLCLTLDEFRVSWFWTVAMEKNPNSIIVSSKLPWSNNPDNETKIFKSDAQSFSCPML